MNIINILYTDESVNIPLNVFIREKTSVNKIIVQIKNVYRIYTLNNAYNIDFHITTPFIYYLVAYILKKHYSNKNKSLISIDVNFVVESWNFFILRFENLPVIIVLISPIV